jgi:hypothetical protein
MESSADHITRMTVDLLVSFGMTQAEQILAITKWADFGREQCLKCMAETNLRIFEDLKNEIQHIYLIYMLAIQRANLAGHLPVNPIEAFSITEEQYKVLWAVRPTTISKPVDEVDD